ncbi:Cell division control protein [Lachnellula suecica]|uniref:Cell division control protein n=1 Tax=Lachnellula suecica TaxID=602035 RepID=A0A8T9BVH5_9HELO|nr:Cell division control protein [Lachnellula suecica]
MSISPTKESIPKLAPPNTIPIHDPPSPGTHRALRRLQSSHTLGQSQPSLIQQQHRQNFQRNQSPANTPHHARGRSNSDAANMTPPRPGAAAARRPIPMSSKKPVAADACSLERLIRDGPPDGDLVSALDSARLKILDQGIPSDKQGMSTLRIYAWLILLNAPILETDSYLALIHRGASPVYSKIKNDTFRTLKTDPFFVKRVSESSLVRLLNAVAWKLQDAKEEKAGSLAMSRSNKLTHTASLQGSPELQSSTPAMKSRARAITLTTEGSDAGNSESGTYVQGMNVLAAPFLYAARSEAEAFVAFHHLITVECPGYVRGAMDGVHKGLALVDKVLEIVDEKLYLYLIGKGMPANLYAFPSVLTLCACTPPLPQVLNLWDFLFAYGAHLNILCIVAQLVVLRTSILNEPSPTLILRKLPPLQADIVKGVALSFVKQIPDDLYAEIVSHAK